MLYKERKIVAILILNELLNLNGSDAMEGMMRS
jgi:hypothetical protein